MGFKKILNRSEDITHTMLKTVCEKYDAAVFAKVRVADVLPIEQKAIGYELSQFALQAHFDFVVSSAKYDPFFAVEFDGPSHKTDRQIERDNKKNRICEIFQFPLVRINPKYLYNKYRDINLLSWFIEVWFTRQQFFDAQNNGDIPEEEMFDPQMIVSLPDKKGLFPLWLSLDVLSQIRKLAEAKKIKYPLPTGEWIGIDDSGNYHGIMWLWIDEDIGVCAQSAMRAQNFPVVETDILGEILIFQLFNALLDVLDKKAPATPIRTLIEEIKTFEAKYTVRRSAMTYIPPGTLDSIA